MKPWAKEVFVILAVLSLWGCLATNEPNPDDTEVTASFTYSPASPTPGQAVMFTDTSTGSPTSWQWSFGDGATSTSQNPSHAYASTATYPVTLVAGNGSSSSTVSHSVVVSPVSTLTASFTYSPASPTPGQAVTFTDTSTGSPTSWQWSFGDGATSTSQNPSHTYATTGSKTATLTASNASGTDMTSRTVTVISGSAVLIDHNTDTLTSIPAEWIARAKETLHIAYGHSSHGSQLATGMAGLVQWKGLLYAWNSGGVDGALDLKDYCYDFGGLGIANDLGATASWTLDRTAWERATRIYLPLHPEVNVIIWAWCWQVNGTEAEIQLYLDLMSQLEIDYPNVKFVYMTGHVNGTELTDNYCQRNQQIRDYCVANNKILYDFAAIESYDPDGTYYGDKLVADDCSYDSDGDGINDRNWAIDWQNAHPGEWYNCESAHSQPLNANMKAYAAWWLWARLAGWNGQVDQASPRSLAHQLAKFSSK